MILLDLLPETGRLLGAEAQSADLAHYVHHQGRDKFDVLRSQPLALATEQRVSPRDVDAIHAVAAKYYRLILMDSGNDESDPMWLRMIDHADQLVVATTTRKDHAETERIAAGYRTLVRAVVRIPHDPALVDGQITYEALSVVSRRAWLGAAAAVAHGLGAS